MNKLVAMQVFMQIIDSGELRLVLDEFEPPQLDVNVVYPNAN